MALVKGKQTILLGIPWRSCLGNIRCHYYISIFPFVRQGLCCLWRGIYRSFRIMGMGH